MSPKPIFVLLGLGTLALTGCLSPVRQEVDALVCHRASQPVDLLPPRAVSTEEAKAGSSPEIAGIQLVGGKDDKLGSKFAARLQPPPGLPGADAPKFDWPANFSKLTPKEQDAILAKYFPVQASMGPDPTPGPGPAGKPLTLSDLQRLAREHSPLLRQAASDIKAAEGAAVQAGLYPNPALGLTAAGPGPSGGPTFGPTISQTIKTMGKLKLAQAAAQVDVLNSQLAYRRAETDLMASVRTAYFAVLAAQKAMRANKALSDLTDEVYKVMQAQLKGGQVATYEVAQLGVYAGNARIALLQSRNGYLLAWKQLTSALGLSTLRPTELDGSIDENLPRFEYEAALAHILSQHTDVLTAQNAIEKARLNLRLAQVTPVPDVTLQLGVTYDATPPGPPRYFPSFTGSVPVPIFDRNQGAIRQAQGQLMRAIEEPHRVQSALSASLADAFRRLDDNRRALDYYRKQLLPQQVQAFRGTVARHDVGEGGVAFTDLIQAEQNLVTLIASYLTTLQAYWQAVSDIASLLQTDDVYQMASEVERVPAPDLFHLLKLPCCHPCSSLPPGSVGASLSFESPAGQRVAPEFGEQPEAILPLPKTPIAPKETAIPVEPIGVSPVEAPSIGPTAAPASQMPVRLGPLTIIPSATIPEAGRN